VPDEEGRIALAERVVKENLTVRQTENLASLISVSKEPKAPKPPTPQSYKQAARELREILDTKVRVKDGRGGKHKIEIEFGDEDDLARIIEAFQRAAGSEMGE
jgi:ParB family chromosome partitioning protein